MSDTFAVFATTYCQLPVTTASMTAFMARSQNLSLNFLVTGLGLVRNAYLFSVLKLFMLFYLIGKLALELGRDSSFSRLRHIYLKVSSTSLCQLIYLAQ